MKTLKTSLLSFAVVALLGASALSAQTRATATIPFEFIAENTTLPAGEYTMSSSSTTHDVLAIRNVDTRKAILVLASGSQSGYRRTLDKNVVVFHKIGDRYFLADVKTDAVSGHLGTSKVERELAAEAGGQPMAAVIVPALSVR